MSDGLDRPGGRGEVRRDAGSPRGVPPDPSRGQPRGRRELSVVVVGDVVLDRDVLGTSDRVSPDMGAPVLAVETVSQTPGGAGLTALLCGAPGVHVTLVAPVATDPPGRALAEALHRRVGLVPLAHEGGTRVKARLFAHDTAMLRLDTGGSGRPLGPTPAELARVRAVLAEADVVLVSDYGAGTTRDPQLRRLLAEAARERTVVWDPHPRGGPPVPGVTVVTPNLAEARAAVASLDGPDADAGARRSPAELGAVLRRAWQAGAVCVTTGADGVTVATGDGAVPVAPPLVAHGDPCGAGDRFAASVALELAAGEPVHQAVTRAVADSAAWVDGVGAQFRHSFGDDGPVDLGGPDPTGGSPARPESTGRGVPARPAGGPDLTASSAPPAAPSSRPAASSTSCTPATSATSPRPAPWATRWWCW